MWRGRDDMKTKKKGALQNAVTRIPLLRQQEDVRWRF